MATACTGVPTEDGKDLSVIPHTADTAGPILEGCDLPGTICRIAGSDSGVLGYNGEALPALDSWLYFPTALAWMPDGRLLIDDFNNMRLRVVEVDGVLNTTVGNGIHAYAEPLAPSLESPMENPVDISVGPDGAVYIAELHAARDRVDVRRDARRGELPQQA